MQTREIPTHEWVPFLNLFSKRHQGESATVEILSQEHGLQREAQPLPLVGVMVDLKDGGEQIEVIVGGEPNCNIMHAVARPKTVRVAIDDQDVDQALEIRSEDGAVTLITFHA